MQLLSGTQKTKRKYYTCDVQKPVRILLGLYIVPIV